MKARQPLLALATLAAILALAPAAASASCAYAGRSVNTMSLARARGATLCLLNAQRRAHGLPALRPSLRLHVASERHSRDMVRRRYFAHGNFVARIIAAGYIAGASSWRVGENIAWGAGGRSTPRTIVRSWMGSAPHRHNILTGSFRHVGIGLVRGTPPGAGGGTYTTDFGTRR